MQPAVMHGQCSASGPAACGWNGACRWTDSVLQARGPKGWRADLDRGQILAGPGGAGSRDVAPALADPPFDLLLVQHQLLCSTDGSMSQSALL